MNVSLQSEFIESCASALEDGTFRGVVFSRQGENGAKEQSKFELVAGGKRRLIQRSGTHFPKDKSAAVPLEVAALVELFRSDVISPFRAATLYSTTSDLHYAENRKKVARLYTSKATRTAPPPEHNRRKNYVLREDRPYLHQLGVTNDRGGVVKKHYGKFRQIANFVEIIDREIGAFVEAADDPISMLDLGCGKGYLTFATYDYVQSRAKQTPNGLGIDIKANVIDLCNSIAQNLEFSGLTFRNARIEPHKPQDVDILIALHACDTATDDALALGLRSNMKYLFCAPCCQAEIAAQIADADAPFGAVTQFPLMRRRQADILTDTCRALLLKALGYDVKFLEFTAMEHTSKNVMLVGSRSEVVDRAAAYREYQMLKTASGFKRHALEENVRDMLVGLKG